MSRKGRERESSIWRSRNNQRIGTMHNPTNMAKCSHMSHTAPLCLLTIHSIPIYCCHNTMFDQAPCPRNIQLLKHTYGETNARILLDERCTLLSSIPRRVDTSRRFIIWGIMLSGSWPNYWELTNRRAPGMDP
jgi:hypothetical protein